MNEYGMPLSKQKKKRVEKPSRILVLGGLRKQYYLTGARQPIQNSHQILGKKTFILLHKFSQNFIQRIGLMSFQEIPIFGSSPKLL